MFSPQVIIVLRKCKQNMEAVRVYHKFTRITIYKGKYVDNFKKLYTKEVFVETGKSLKQLLNHQ